MAMCFDGTRRDVGEPVDPFVENAMYSGYTGTHCVAYIGTVTPDGIIIWVVHMRATTQTLILLGSLKSIQISLIF